MEGVIKFPYHRTSDRHRVMFSKDTSIELYDTYLVINVSATEEAPVDLDDPMLGDKQYIKDGRSVLLKSHIVAIDQGWDNSSGSYDFTIYTSGVSYAYNCADKQTSVRVGLELSHWLLS